MNMTPYTLKVRGTASGNYFVQVWKDGELIYTTQEYREAEHAAQEAREWLDPDQYTDPHPDNLTISQRIARAIQAFASDPSQIRR